MDTVQEARPALDPGISSGHPLGMAPLSLPSPGKESLNTSRSGGPAEVALADVSCLPSGHSVPTLEIKITDPRAAELYKTVNVNPGSSWPLIS